MPAIEVGLKQLYSACGLPLVTTDEVSGWNKLDVDSSTKATVQVGLFGYDMSCLAEMCDAEVTGQEYNVMGSYWGYCGLVKARHLDGLAFGVHWSIPFTSGTTFGAYCAGWRNDEPGNRVGNSMVCGTDTDVVKTYRFFEGYQVSDGFFTGDYDSQNTSSQDAGLNAQGLGAWAFRSFYQSWDGSGTHKSTEMQAFRFIGQEENDHDRWSVGDEINMFFLDQENSKFADNEAFVLEGAAQLAVSGAVLLASAFLM